MLPQHRPSWVLVPLADSITTTTPDRIHFLLDNPLHAVQPAQTPGYKYEVLLDNHLESYVHSYVPEPTDLPPFPGPHILCLVLVPHHCHPNYTDII